MNTEPRDPITAMVDTECARLTSRPSPFRTPHQVLERIAIRTGRVLVGVAVVVFGYRFLTGLGDDGGIFTAIMALCYGLLAVWAAFGPGPEPPSLRTIATANVRERMADAELLKKHSKHAAWWYRHAGPVGFLFDAEAQRRHPWVTIAAIVAIMVLYAAAMFGASKL